MEISVAEGGHVADGVATCVAKDWVVVDWLAEGDRSEVVVVVKVELAAVKQTAVVQRIRIDRKKEAVMVAVEIIGFVRRHAGAVGGGRVDVVQNCVESRAGLWVSDLS